MLSVRNLEAVGRRRERGGAYWLQCQHLTDVYRPVVRAASQRLSLGKGCMRVSRRSYESGSPYVCVCLRVCEPYFLIVPI